jgi:hypothetical protein
MPPKLPICFHVVRAESPTVSTPVIWSRGVEGNAHSATIRWKHIGFLVCSLLVHLYRVSNVALRHMNKQV